MKTQILCDEQAFDAIRDKWTNLISRVPSASVFQTWEWNRCWWRNFGQDSQLFIIIAIEEDSIYGIAPLCLRLEKNCLKHFMQAEFIGASNYSSDYCDFIIDPQRPDVFLQLLDCLTEYHHLWRRLDFFNYPDYSPNLEFLKSYFNSMNLPSICRQLYDAPSLVFSHTDADEKLTNRKSLNKKIRHFQKSGSIEYLNFSNPEAISPWLEPFFSSHISRWSSPPVLSQFLNPQQQAFYHDLTQDLGRQGWLRFSVVLFNNEPAAMHFGFEFNKKFTYYKVTYDSKYSSSSPGEVLLNHLIHTTMKKRLDEFDFAAGDEAYKYRYANTIRINRRLTVYESKTSCWMRYVIDSLKDKRRTLKESLSRTATNDGLHQMKLTLKKGGLKDSFGAPSKEPLNNLRITTSKMDNRIPKVSSH